jgi:hypothetical protein
MRFKAIDLRCINLCRYKFNSLAQMNWVVVLKPKEEPLFPFDKERPLPGSALPSVASGADAKVLILPVAMARPIQ